jgi:hypothetical protein
VSPIAGAIVAIILFIVVGAGTGWLLAFLGVASIALDRVKQGAILWALGVIVWLIAIVLAITQVIHLVTLIF